MRGGGEGQLGKFEIDVFRLLSLKTKRPVAATCELVVGISPSLTSPVERR